VAKRCVEVDTMVGQQKYVIQLGIELGRGEGKVIQLGIEPKPMEPVSLKLDCFGCGR
jgi:hypothetical protein